MRMPSPGGSRGRRKDNEKNILAVGCNGGSDKEKDLLKLSCIYSKKNNANKFWVPGRKSVWGTLGLSLTKKEKCLLTTKY